MAEETARTAGPSPGLDGSADATNARASDSSSRRAAVRLEGCARQRGPRARATRRGVGARARASRGGASSRCERDGAPRSRRDGGAASTRRRLRRPRRRCRRRKRPRARRPPARELRDANATIDALRSEMKIKDAATAAMRADARAGGPGVEGDGDWRTTEERDRRRERAGGGDRGVDAAIAIVRVRARALEAQREDRAVERLTRELFASKATCDALRAQMDRRARGGREGARRSRRRDGSQR